MSNEGIFNNGIQMPVQLQKVNEPVNWQHYRIHAAIAAMVGLMAGQYIVPPDKMAVDAVRYADALIAELQKKQD